jgi:multidrug efflux pump subunit AcrA (membrane-fusion protein)
MRVLLPAAMSLSNVTVGILMGISLAGCGRVEAPVETPRPRPVSTVALTRTVPLSQARHAASVSAWKSQDFGFEVGGRVVEMLVEPGTDVEGPDIDPDSTRFIPRTGGIIGRLDPQRFQARLNSAEAGVATAQARLQAIEREIENVLPRQIAAAQATVVLARQDFQRSESLARQQAETPAALEKAQADMDTAEAQLQQMEANVAVREAEKASLVAQLEEAREAVRQAQQDLDDTVLYAPFQGQISAVYETVGSVVQGGQAVARAQMMDPIQVEVQVSAETDASLFYNDMVFVHPSDGSAPVPAMVYEKAAVADAATRTFLVTLLIRNERVLYGFPEQFDRDRDVRTRDVGGVFVQTVGGRSVHYVRESGLHRDDDGEFVWRVKGITRPTSEARLPNRLEVERVDVRSGPGRIAFLSVAVARELEETGDLNPATDLIIGGILSMDGRPLADPEASRRLAEAGVIHWVRDRWRFRPGDMAEVDLRQQPAPAGFYLPMDAITRNPADEEDASVFVLDEGRARKIPIRLIGDPVGSRRQIEPRTGDGLREGDQVIVGGVHFLVDGEPVRPAGMAGER